MNIHLLAVLMFTGYQGFEPQSIAISLTGQCLLGPLLGMIDGSQFCYSGVWSRNPQKFYSLLSYRASYSGQAA